MEDMKYTFSARPSFLADGGITSAERGTAMHKVLQFFDFDKCDYHICKSSKVFSNVCC